MSNERAKCQYIIKTVMIRRNCRKVWYSSWARTQMFLHEKGSATVESTIARSITSSSDLSRLNWIIFVDIDIRYIRCEPRYASPTSVTFGRTPLNYGIDRFTSVLQSEIPWNRDSNKPSSNIKNNLEDINEKCASPVPSRVLLFLLFKHKHSIREGISVLAHSADAIPRPIP